MLPLRERLSRASLSSLGRARRVAGPHLSAALPLGRGVAVIISKKTVRLATKRHLLKRRILGALRYPPALARPAALVLYPKASALELSPRELREELTTLLAKAA